MTHKDPVDLSWEFSFESDLSSAEENLDQPIIPESSFDTTLCQSIKQWIKILQ